MSDDQGDADDGVEMTSPSAQPPLEMLSLLQCTPTACEEGVRHQHHHLQHVAVLLGTARSTPRHGPCLLPPSDCILLLGNGLVSSSNKRFDFDKCSVGVKFGRVDGRD